MKSIILILLIIFIGSCGEKHDQQAKVNKPKVEKYLGHKDCSKTCLDISFFLHKIVKQRRGSHATISLYKDGEKLKMENFRTVDHKRGNQIHDLPLGDYTIRYQSIFQKTINFDIQLAKDTVYKLSLYKDILDYSKETYVPYIDRLQNNESYSISIKSKGCRQDKQDYLVVEKRNHDYFIQFNNEEKRLSSSDIKSIQEFEMELMCMKKNTKNLCTTKVLYTLIYKNNEIKIEDRSCQWKGNRYLMYQLGYTL